MVSVSLYCRCMVTNTVIRMIIQILTRVIHRFIAGSVTYKNVLSPQVIKHVASSAGFEPATYSLEGCCSIQLSYEEMCTVYLGFVFYASFLLL